MKFLLLIASCLLVSYTESVVQHASYGGYSCVDNFCANGGTCVDHPGSEFFGSVTPSYATCTCPTGFKGAYCEYQLVTDCWGNQAPDVWVGDGICQDGNAKYDGKYISFNCAAQSSDGGDCGSSPTSKSCTAGTCGTGKCYGTDSKHWCACPRDSAGSSCQITVDACATSPCLNGARCINDINEPYNYKCVCTGGYSDTNCTTPYVAPTCDGNCGGNGICYGTNLCFCNTGYYGSTTCEANTACNDSPCKNGATCRPSTSTNTYSCTCASGYYGTNCDGTSTACSSNPCQNGGTCVASTVTDSYSCTCPSGYSGSTNCATYVAICHPEPCQHSGFCTGSISTYSCSCASGYRAINCSYAITSGFDCASQSSQNMIPSSWLTDGVCEHHYSYLKAQADTGNKVARYVLVDNGCGSAGDKDCATEVSNSSGVRFTFGVLSAALLFIAHALL